MIYDFKDAVLAIDALTRRVDSLTERLSVLESGLLVEVDEYMMRGFTRNQSLVVATLMKHEFASRHHLEVLLYGSSDNVPDSKTVDMAISRARSKFREMGLDGHVIQNRHGEGWYINYAAKGQIREVMDSGVVVKKVGHRPSRAA